MKTWRHTTKSISELLTELNETGLKISVSDSSDGVNQVATIYSGENREETAIGHIYKTFNESLEPCFYAALYAND